MSLCRRAFRPQLGSDPVRALSIGDIDRDGLADVIISRKSQLSWLANRGPKLCCAIGAFDASGQRNHD